MRPSHPGTFADYLETSDFAFNIKFYPQKKTFTVEMLDGFN